VRVEIAAALSRGTPMVPVLVGNAAMPRALIYPHCWSHSLGKMLWIFALIGLARTLIVS
jgi:hypothetical protein